MVVYGYARVSTDGQSLAAQLAELKVAKCEKIFQDIGIQRPKLCGDLCRLIGRHGSGAGTFSLDRSGRMFRRAP